MWALDEYAPLTRVALRHPRAAFRDQAFIDASWQALHYRAAPDFARAVAEHDALAAILADSGAQVEYLPGAPELSLDAIFARDATVMTPFGCLPTRMAKIDRAAEPSLNQAHYLALGIDGRPALERGHLEGGDLVWLDRHQVAVGEGYRTNADGIASLRALLPDDVAIEVCPLPHYRGPDSVFHLMSLLSPLDADLALVYSPFISVRFRRFLLERGIRLVETPDEEFEGSAATSWPWRRAAVSWSRDCPRPDADWRQPGARYSPMRAKRYPVKAMAAPRASRGPSSGPSPSPAPTETADMRAEHSSPGRRRSLGPHLRWLLLGPLVLACSGPSQSVPRVGSQSASDASLIRAVAPPAQGARGATDDWPVAARIFAFADSQFHYQFGKRTFAQSPFAERMSFEVAVRPTALDESSDLLLALFLNAYRARYPGHTPVFLGDAADLSCTHELDEFTRVLADAGLRQVLAVTSNHDGFYAGNFTSKKDGDGMLGLTDMPEDWARACSRPGRLDDYRLTKGRAVAGFRALLPTAPPWATASAADAEGPTEYRDTYLYYVRPLGGGDAGAPPVFGVFLDTVDYRGFDFESSRGAGSNGSVSAAQLAFLDKAMFEAGLTAKARNLPVTFVLFGHHPFRSMESATAARVRRFLSTHRNIVAYISAHKHKALERHIDLGDRQLPELVVGSTTDAPQSARTIEVRVSVDGNRSISNQRLVLEPDTWCADIQPMDDDTSGYVGYRILRDGVPGLTLSMLEKLLFVAGLDDLAQKRALQALGALLMENELVRSWARLYRDAPIARTPEDERQLDDILRKRYAAGAGSAELRPYFKGTAPVEPREQSGDIGYDPVIARLLTVAERGVHRFADHTALITRLRTQRTQNPQAHRYFTCHAIHAARAEAKRSRTRGNVLYIR